MKPLKKDTLNFLPKELGKSKITKDCYYVSALMGLFLIYVIVGASQFVKKINREKELKRITTSSGLKTIEIDKINKQLAALEKREATQTALKSISDKRILWGDHFKEISLLLPKGVWVSEMQVKAVGDKIEIGITGESISYKEVSNFYQRLSQSINYSSLLINSSEIDTTHIPPLTRFEFRTPNAALTGGKK